MDETLTITEAADNVIDFLMVNCSLNSRQLDQMAVHLNEFELAVRADERAVMAEAAEDGSL
jgi:hypothetical protein